MCIRDSTHFSQIRDTATKALELHRLVDAHVAIARREKNAGADRHGRIRKGLEQLLLSETSHFGCRLPASGILEIFDADLELNAQGLGVWVDAEK